MSKPLIVIITGKPGCGKTWLCQRLADRARQQGLATGGVISVAGATTADLETRDVLDLRTGQRRRLAARAVFGPEGKSAGWRLDANGLTWGSTVLREAVPCDLLVVDELGPLELLGGGGWAVALDVLRSGGYRLAAVVVRPGLVAAAQERLGRPAQVFFVSAANRDALPERVIELVLRRD